MSLVQHHDFENYLFSTFGVICKQSLLLNRLYCQRGFAVKQSLLLETVRQAWLLDKGSRRALGDRQS